MKFFNKLKYQKEIKPLNFFYYYIPVVLIALIGIADTLYLAVSHYRVYTDIGYKSFCAVSRAINCDTVSQSSYSIFIQIPLPIWGLLGYTFVLILLAFAGSRPANKKRIWAVLFWILLLYSVHSVILAGISSFIIGSYCLMCIISYLINFSLLYYCWFINKRFGDRNLISGIVPDFQFLANRKRFVLPVCCSYGAIIISLIAFMPHYWQMNPPKQLHSMNRGITEEGHPWIGAENPELVITEYTDYLCFQCRKFHYYLRELISDNPGKIKLIHRHFPLDHNYNPIVKERFHVGSGKLAILAIYAQQHDKFWEANDILFNVNTKSKVIKIQEIAGALGLDYKQMSRAQFDPGIQAELVADIKAGLALGMTGTPGFVIDDKLYQGYIPAHILQQAID